MSDEQEKEPTKRELMNYFNLRLASIESDSRKIREIMVWANTFLLMLVIAVFTMLMLSLPMKMDLEAIRRGVGK